MKDMWRRLPLKKKIVVLLTLLCIGLTIGYLPEPYPHVLTKEEIKEAESVSRSQTEVLAPNVSLIDQAGHTVSMQSLYNKKPVLLYFWMSWSDMAAKELPVLDDMYRQQGRDVYFVIVWPGPWRCGTAAHRIRLVLRYALIFCQYGNGRHI